MANDIFTGVLSGSPADWSVTADWSAGQPETSAVVEQTGEASILSGSYAVAGLVLDSGANLIVGLDGELNVSGAGDAAFGGASTTIDVSGLLTVGSDVTSAAGAVNVGGEGRFEFDGSGSMQSVTIDPLGEFDLGGAHNDPAITTSATSTLELTGTNDGGTLNLASGGTVFMASPYAGTIENLSSSGGIALYVGHALNGTLAGFTLDSSNNTVTFNFDTTSGPVAETLTFGSSTPVSSLHIGTDVAGGGYGISVAAPTDTFTGGTASSPVTFAMTSAWSSGQPTPGSSISVTGASVVNETNSGPVEAVSGLTLASGASLDIPTGSGLYVTGFSETPLGGANSTIDVHGGLIVGVFVTGSSGAVNVHPDGYYVQDGAGSAQVVTVQTDGDYVMQGWSNAGTVDLAGGTFEVDGSLDGANNTTGVNLAGGGTFLDKGEQFNGMISGLGANGHVLIADSGSSGGTPTTHVIDTSNNTITFNFSSGDSYTLSFNPSINPVSGLTVTATTTQFSVTCFITGTLIRTTRGEIAVEDLAVGDEVVTAQGKQRPIRWIGHKRIGQPSREQWPVRVMAGAFGDSLPARDLFLSPGHAVCVDVMGEVFTPIEQLINGATIARVEVPEVTYWHVELESHDVLLAEGLGCESYMDCGNRAFFGREYGRLVAIDPGRVAESLTRYARPFVDCGPIVEAIRQRLDVRAEALGSIAPKAAEVYAAA